MTTKLAVGVGLPSVENGALDAARAVETVGLDHVSLPDLLIGDGTPSDEAITLAAAVAAVTSRVRLEFGVLVPGLRSPAVLAAQLANLQRLSGDRVVLGVGIGGFADSPVARSLPEPLHRGRALDRMLDVLPGLLGGEPTVIRDGAPPVRFAPATMPPVLVGGGSEHSRRRAVEHADGWFPSLLGPTTLAPLVADLRRLAESRGRHGLVVHLGTHAALGPDADEQAAGLRSHLADGFGLSEDDLAAVPLSGPAVRLAEQLTACAEAGADAVTLTLDGAGWRDQLDVVAAAREILRA